MLRQAKNNVIIRGTLSEVDLKYGSYLKNGKPVESIGGHIVIRVEQEVKGETQINEIPVHMFSTKFTNKGTENPSYASIEQAMNEFVSIAAAASVNGRPDNVEITNGSLTMNEFYDKSGRLVFQPRVKASFVSRITKEFKPEATFSAEILVSGIKEVVDNDGVAVEPRKLEVESIVSQYGGKVDVMKFYVTSPNAVNSVETYWKNGNTYDAKGRLNFTSVTVTEIEQPDFGEPTERTRTRTVSEMIITGGSQTALEGEYEFDIQEINAALVDRKNRLEQTKNKNLGGRKTPVPAAKNTLMTQDLGF